MAYGHFVDIYQQDGTPVRMFYPMTKQNEMFCKWVGINEEHAKKFRSDQNDNS